ncbi:redox-regulated ATPase YchF [Chloroflexota bacterium]
MGLNCGLVGLPYCGKTTIFNAITVAGVASYNGSEMNHAVVNVPDQRITRLVGIYHPAKVVSATLEVVDIPGLKTGSTVGEGWGSRLLGYIKDADALLYVVRCFEDGSIPFEYSTVDPARDVETIDFELMVADSQTLQKKIERLAKKALKDEDVARQVNNCRRVLNALQEGTPARKQSLNDEELASIRECNLLSLKPVLYIANIKNMGDASGVYVGALQSIAATEGSEVVVVCGRDEAEIGELDFEDRLEFMLSFGLEESSMERLLCAAYKRLGLINFFTAGETEVHAWTCRRDDSAPVAAGKIHSDMEKGFIRMEVIRYDDLVELGSESAVLRAGKHRVVGKNYEVQEGDIVIVLFNPA